MDLWNLLMRKKQNDLEKFAQKYKIIGIDGSNKEEIVATIINFIKYESGNSYPLIVHELFGSLSTQREATHQQVIRKPQETSAKPRGSCLEYCPKCEELLRPFQEVDGFRYLRCRVCGYRRQVSNKQDLSMYRLSAKGNPNSPLLIKDESYYDKLKSSLSNFKCPSCGYNKCTVDDFQVRVAHKGMAHFIICLRCGHQCRIES